MNPCICNGRIDDNILITLNSGKAMATVNVRQLDDRVVQRLKRRAAANHRSLESEARHILAAAAEDDVAMKRKSFQELMARLRRGTKGHVQTPSEILIREDRESGHRII